MKPCIYILFALSVSCTAGDTPRPYDEKIVVEGFIEEGKTPVVWLSKSLYVPYGVEQDIEAVRKIPIKWAKVTVTHQGREEILAAGPDPDGHMLGWRYHGRGDIRGVRGGEYTLTVEYSGYTLTATTTIPATAPARLGELTVARNSDGKEEFCQVNTSFEDTSADGYYMLMAKTRSVDGDESGGGVYNPCVFGTVEGASLDGEASVTVFRPMTLESEEGYVPSFRPGERVSLRLASIDRKAFDFWSYFMNDILNAHNPIYPSSANLPSNIEGGGLGIWYGFSADYGEADLAR